MFPPQKVSAIEILEIVMQPQAWNYGTWYNAVLPGRGGAVLYVWNPSQYTAGSMEEPNLGTRRLATTYLSRLVH